MSRSIPADAFALLTPQAPGAVAVLRVQGPDAPKKLGANLRDADPERLKNGQHVHTRLGTGDETVDDVVLLRHPGSPDDLPVFDLCLHGGPGVRKAVRNLLTDAGFDEISSGNALAAEVMRGEITLLEAEEVLALSKCRTDRQARAAAGAARILEGELRSLAANLTNDRAYQNLAKRARFSRQLFGEHILALVGPVNAGKSTLANRLLRESRAIVSPEPGTTRDVVEHVCALRGLTLRAIDTAGWRPGQTGLEMEGYRRAVEAARKATVTVLVLDATNPAGDAAGEALARAGVHPHIVVRNKCDIARADTSPDVIAISALTGQGLTHLEDRIERALLGDDFPSCSGQNIVLFSERQYALADKMAGNDTDRAKCIAILHGDGATAEEIEAALGR